MDSDHAPRKVNDAIQRGLAQCRHSVAPIVTLARFVDDLHADPTWHPSEIMAVEKAIRHILVSIMDGNGSGQPTRTAAAPARRDSSES